MEQHQKVAANDLKNPNSNKHKVICCLGAGIEKKKKFVEIIFIVVIFKKKKKDMLEVLQWQSLQSIVQT